MLRRKPTRIELKPDNTELEKVAKYVPEIKEVKKETSKSEEIDRAIGYIKK